MHFIGAKKVKGKLKNQNRFRLDAKAASKNRKLNRAICVYMRCCFHEAMPGLIGCLCTVWVAMRCGRWRRCGMWLAARCGECARAAVGDVVGR